MTDYRIDCINKPHRNSPHEHITHAGGLNPNGTGRWKDIVINIVQMIERGQHRFYTSEGGKTAWVGVCTAASGAKYIRTHADGAWNDNLLALQECG